jgi:hypothetical protein
LADVREPLHGVRRHPRRFGEVLDLGGLRDRLFRKRHHLAEHVAEQHPLGHVRSEAVEKVVEDAVRFARGVRAPFHGIAQLEHRGRRRHAHDFVFLDCFVEGGAVRDLAPTTVSFVTPPTWSIAAVSLFACMNSPWPPSDGGGPIDRLFHHLDRRRCLRRSAP